MKLTKKNLIIGGVAIAVLLIAAQFLLSSTKSLSLDNVDIAGSSLFITDQNADYLEVEVDGKVVHRTTSHNGHDFHVSFFEFLKRDELTNVALNLVSGNGKKTVKLNNMLMTSDAGHPDLSKVEHYIQIGFYTPIESKTIEALDKNRLKTLIISSADNKFDYSTLNEFKSLRTLHVTTKQKNTTLSSLAENKRITSFTFYDTGMNKLDFFEGMTSLKLLRFSTDKSYDLIGLEPLKKLKVLSVSAKSIKGTFSNKKIEKLHVRSADSYMLADFNVSELSKLKSLSVYGSYEGDYSDIPKIKSISSLSISSSKMDEDDIYFFEDFPNLVWLYVNKY